MDVRRWVRTKSGRDLGICGRNMCGGVACARAHVHDIINLVWHSQSASHLD